MDYFGVFCWILDKISKSRQFRGPTPRRRDPTQRRPRGRLRQVLGRPRRSNATPWRRPTPQRNTVHRHVFLSYFAILLFRGLVYWTNEDPISL